MSPEHVGALNLVEIEFQDEQKVIGTWKNYFEHLASNHQRRPEEQIIESLSQEELQTRNNQFDQRIFSEREKLLAKLLHAIALKLGFKIEQLEIFEGGYVFQGGNDIELQQEAIRRFLVGLYLGHIKLPVAVTDYTTQTQNSENSEKSH